MCRDSSNRTALSLQDKLLEDMFAEDPDIQAHHLTISARLCQDLSLPERIPLRETGYQLTKLRLGGAASVSTWVGPRIHFQFLLATVDFLEA